MTKKERPFLLCVYVYLERRRVFVAFFFNFISPLCTFLVAAIGVGTDLIAQVEDLNFNYTFLFVKFPSKIINRFLTDFMVILHHEFPPYIIKVHV